MKKRHFLSATGTAVAGSLAGCLQSIENAVNSDPCSSGDVEEVSYNITEISGTVMAEPDRTVALATDSEHIDKFNRTYAFIDETDFNEAFFVGIRHNSSSGSSEFLITSVGWEDESTIHVFSCVREPSSADDINYESRLLRIPYKSATQEVTTALVTNSTPDSEMTWKDTV